MGKLTEILMKDTNIKQTNIKSLSNFSSIALFDPMVTSFNKFRIFTSISNRQTAVDVIVLLVIF